MTDIPQHLGRPSSFSREIFDEICDRMACGEMVMDICNGQDGMPQERTFYRWLVRASSPDCPTEMEGICQKYAIALRVRADAMIERAIKESRQVRTGESHTISKDGEIETIDKIERFDNVARARLDVDTAKWAAAKFHPKKYGNNYIDDGDNIRRIVIENDPDAV